LAAHSARNYETALVCNYPRCRVPLMLWISSWPPGLPIRTRLTASKAADRPSAILSASTAAATDAIRPASHPGRAQWYPNKCASVMRRDRPSSSDSQTQLLMPNSSGADACRKRLLDCWRARRSKSVFEIRPRTIRCRYRLAFQAGRQQNRRWIVLDVCASGPSYVGLPDRCPAVKV
jgi:hypothetical protein